MATEKDVRRIALSLPGTSEEGVQFRVDGKGFAWQWVERVEEVRRASRAPDIFAIRVAGEGMKQALIESEPDKFFAEAHYNGFPAVLVRLAAVGADELEDLLTGAWRLQAKRSRVKEFDAGRSAN